MVKQLCYIQNDRYKKLTPLFLGEEECESSHSCGPKVHMYWLIHFVLSGKGTYTVGDKCFTVEKGQAFVIKPGEVTAYCADKDEPWHYVWVSFEYNGEELEHVPYIIDDDGIRQCFNAIDRDFELIASNTAYAVAHIWRIFARLSKTDISVKNGNAYVSNALNIIHNQFMQDISVKSISDQLGLDRSYFSNLFKMQLGVTPMQYIISYRMQKALSLLNLKKYSVSVVATSVGYSDLFSFSRSFKKYFGVPPQKYKEIQTNGVSFEI